MFPKFNYLLCSQVLTETCSLNTGLSVLFSSHDLYIHCFPYICPCPQPRNQSRLLASRDILGYAQMHATLYASSRGR